MSGFLGEREGLTRQRVRELIRDKEYSFIEEKVELIDIRGETFLVKISFLVEYRKRMISLELEIPFAVPFNDFKVEDWGNGVRKIGDIL